MIVVNKDKLKAEWRHTLEYAPTLEEFLFKVAMLKPTCSFAVSDKCVAKEHYIDKEDDNIRKSKDFIYKIRVYDNGEKLGDIGITDRYRNGSSERCYFVSSHRILKFRGGRNTTTTADLKVAIRAVKQSFSARAEDELKTQIRNQIQENINSQHNQGENTIRWDFDQNSELAFYAMEAYKARSRGDKYAMMPVRPVSIKNLDAHDKKCEAFEHISALFHMVKAKLGYGIKTNPMGGLVVYDLATDTITKYGSFSDLPENIQHKYAMFKVLSYNEPITTIGCKFNDEYCYVVQ
jgi:hypothetical protein